MTLEDICTPALIYLVFSVTHIILDTSKGLYNTAIMKFIVAIIFTTLLNYLCVKGLNYVSWIIVFIPFMLMTVIIALLLIMFGLHPKTGRLNINSNNPSPPKKPDARRDVMNLDYSNKYYDGTNNTTVYQGVNPTPSDDTKKTKSVSSSAAPTQSTSNSSSSTNTSSSQTLTSTSTSPTPSDDTKKNKTVTSSAAPTDSSTSKTITSTDIPTLSDDSKKTISKYLQLFLQKI